MIYLALALVLLSALMAFVVVLLLVDRRRLHQRLTESQTAVVREFRHLHDDLRLLRHEMRELNRMFLVVTRDGTPPAGSTIPDLRGAG